MLADFRAAAARSAESAPAFGADPSAAATAARIGGPICAARWLEHGLREAAWPLALLDEGTGGPRRRPSVLAAEADALASFSRKWTLRLAKGVADGFGRAARGYVAAAAAGALCAGAPACPPPGPHPTLTPALAVLASSLDALAGCLDAVAFRAAWRGAAAAAVRALFNDVATEASVDAGGGFQLAADAAALAAVLAPYAPRPAAHVRELADAAALLAAEERALGPLRAALAARDGDAAASALRDLGVARLAPDQAAAVLARRAHG